MTRTKDCEIWSLRKRAYIMYRNSTQKYKHVWVHIAHSLFSAAFSHLHTQNFFFFFLFFCSVCIALAYIHCNGMSFLLILLQGEYRGDCRKVWRITDKLRECKRTVSDFHRIYQTQKVYSLTQHFSLKPEGGLTAHTNDRKCSPKLHILFYLLFEKLSFIENLLWPHTHNITHQKLLLSFETCLVNFKRLCLQNQSIYKYLRG